MGTKTNICQVPIAATILERPSEATSRLALQENHTEALQGLLDIARELVIARYAALALWDEKGRIGTWMIAGEPPERAFQTLLMGPDGTGVLNWVRANGQCLRLTDVHDHATLRHLSINHPWTRSFLAVPIKRRGQTIGALCFVHKEDTWEFSEKEEQILNVFAVLAGVLSGNANPYADVVRESGVLAATLSSIPEGIMVIDSYGQLQYLNKAASALLKMDPWKFVGDDQRGMPPGLLPSLELAEESRENLRKALARNSAAPVSVEVTALAPKPRRLVMTVFPVVADREERMHGLLVRQVTNERDLGGPQDPFISMASHELRMPMTPILGFAELLLTRDIPEPTRRKWLGYIYENTRRLTDIVDDLLNVSRIQSGKAVAATERLSLGGMIKKIVIGARITDRKHRFAVKVPANLPDVAADQGKLEQVLLNLLSNAIKYGPEDGHITVSARHESEKRRVVVAVADEGIGIAAEDQERLFTPFHRIRRPETEGVSGTGLGLFIVKELVEQMHGEIWLESELNKGSTFYFSLPCVPGKEAAYDQESAGG